MLCLMGVDYDPKASLLSSENFLRTSSTLEFNLISLGSILCIIVNSELGLGAGLLPLE